VTVLDTPTLAHVTNQIMALPEWQRERPFCLDHETYAAAKHEMESVMKARGYRLPVRRELRQEHFVVAGVVVTTGECQ
jgi:hypothetical protein